MKTTKQIRQLEALGEHYEYLTLAAAANVAIRRFRRRRAMQKIGRAIIADRKKRKR